MTETIDFKAIAADALLRAETLLFHWLPGGKVEGHEFKVGGLTGEPGKSLSVNINTGVWKDFATDASGADLINLFAAINGLSQADAALAVAEQCGASLPVPPKSKRTRDNWTPIICPPEAEAWPPRHPSLGEPVMVWDYRNERLELLGRVCRFILDDGSKTNRPCCYCEGEAGLRGWKWQAWTKPFLPYQIQKIVQHKDAPVLIVEGEKAADAAQLLFPDFVVTCWPFGAGATANTDWSVLQGRNVIIWPDNDEPGFKAARKLAKLLVDVGTAKTVFVHPPLDLGTGWDLADAPADWTPDAAMERLNKWFQPVPPTWDAGPEHAHDEPADDPVVVEDVPEGETAKPADIHVAPVLAQNAFFRPLGRQGERYFYYASGPRDVIGLERGAHTEANLNALAPLAYWEKVFKGRSDRNKFDVSNARNALFGWSHKLGVFDPDRVRGLGAWWDEGRSIVHVGNRLIENGVEQPLENVKSEYIYCAAKKISFDLSSPLTNAESRELLELIDLLAWENPLSAKFLAGWLALAPACGAWKWRPAIWVTGPRGCGKSWIYEEIVGKCCGDFALMVKGAATSEAGVRQTLKSDAKPVLIDEAGDSRASNRHIRDILELMRQASTDSKSRIVKGTTSGEAQEFNIRSMFGYFSINVGSTNAADDSRITVLELKDQEKMANREQRFAEIQEKQQKLLTEKYCMSLRARIVGLIPVIRENAETFAIVAARALGGRRAGDQVGHLLAGAYALYSSDKVTEEFAAEWIGKNHAKVKRYYQSQEETSDELVCLQNILEYRIDIFCEGRVQKRLIGELIPIAAGIVLHDKILRTTAYQVLLACGIRVRAGDFTVAVRSNVLTDAFKGTMWENAGWSRMLARIEGSGSTEPIRWTSGARCRGTVIPLSAVIDEIEKVPPAPPAAPTGPIQGSLTDPADDYYSGEDTDPDA